MKSANLLHGNGTGPDHKPGGAGACQFEWPCRAGTNALNIPLSMETDKVVGKRILLVDDERLVREVIGRLLAKDAHTVVEANNGVEALFLFTRGRFDLVMTDFEIPFMKGDELATRIKQLAPAQPILMITGYGKRRGGDNPVDAVLNKPIELEQLRATMGRLLCEAGETAAPASRTAPPAKPTLASTTR